MIVIGFDWHRALLYAALSYLPLAILFTLAATGAEWAADQAIAALAGLLRKPPQLSEAEVAGTARTGAPGRVKAPRGLDGTSALGSTSREPVTPDASRRVPTGSSAAGHRAPGGTGPTGSLASPSGTPLTAGSRQGRPGGVPDPNPERSMTS